MSFTSTDINECENSNNCNLPGQKCINGLANFTCFCIKGYYLDRSAGVVLCVTNQSSKLNRLVLVGKYTYCVAPLHVSVNIFLWNLHLIVCELSYSLLLLYRFIFSFFLIFLCALFLYHFGQYCEEH